MTPDGRARAWAMRRNGVISRAALRRAGLTDRQIRQRVTNGTLVRSHPGVFLVAGAPPTFRASVWAALLAAGPDAFASHRTAAVLWGIRRGEPELIDITILGTRGFELQGVRIHRIIDGSRPATRNRHGIPLSAPARTICELAATEPRREVEYAIQEAAANLRLSPAELARAAEAWGARAGRAMLRSILQDETDSELTRSWAERQLLRIVDRAGLPRPEMNVELLGHRPDAVWREAKLIVQVDGIGTHGTPVAFLSDRTELADFTVAGWRLLRPAAVQLRDAPMRVAVQIARVLGTG